MNEKKINRRPDLMILTPAQQESLSFYTLKAFYGHDDASFAKHLNLRMADGRYNLLAELLADQNRFSLKVVKYWGKDKNAVSKIDDYGSQCLLFSYERMKNRLAGENRCAVNTRVRPRMDRWLFDSDSVNEGVFNTLIYNDWTVSSPLILVFSDRLEMISYGQIKNKDLFFKGLCPPRNERLNRIFEKMSLGERGHHGVAMILDRYGPSVFDFGDSYVKVVIPFDPKVMDLLGMN